MEQDIKNLIDNEISNNEVCLFMKGTPDAPQCGFSMAVSNILLLLTPNNFFIILSTAHFKLIAVGLDAIRSTLDFLR